MKDEPVKPFKEPRVFSILSATANNEIKMKLGPISYVMRSFPEWFESIVGIDMSSADSNRIVTGLRRVKDDLR